MATGVEYSYKVVSYYTAGTDTVESLGKDPTKTQSSACATPDAPTGVTVTNKGSTKLKVTWDDMSDKGAEKYIVYGSLDGKTYTELGTTSNLYYTDTSVPTNTTRFYQVTAVITINGTDIEGSKSAVAYEMARPLKPTDVTLTAVRYDKIKITLTMDPDADGVQIWRSTDQKTWTKIYDGTKSAYTDTGLTCGTTYYYKARFYVNGTMKGTTVTKTCAYSAVVSGKATPAAPSTVDITKTHEGPLAKNNYMKVEWTKVTGASGYQVQQKAGSGSWTLVKTITNGSTLACTITGLKLNTTYQYRVRAYRTVKGTNVYGPWTKSGTDSLALKKVASLAATTSPSGTIKLSWTGYYNAAGYRVIMTCTDDPTYSYEKDVTASAVTISGLTLGYQYTAEVYVFVNTSTSIKLGPVATITKEITPTKPTGVTAAQVSNQYAVKVKWTKVSGVDGYMVQRRLASDSTWTTLNTVADDTTAYTDKTLTKSDLGETYYYRVVSYVAAPHGDAKAGSAAVSVSIVPFTTTVEVDAASSNALKVTWNAVDSASGYQVWRSTSANGTYSLVKDTTATSFTNKKLSTGTYYYYKVRAYVTVGSKTYYGNYSKAVGRKVTPVQADAPTGVTVTSAKSVKVTWTAVSGIDAYKVYYSTSISGTYTCAGTYSGTSASISGLTCGKNYYFKLSYVDNGVEGTKSSAVGPYKPIPVKVTGLSYSIVGNKQVKLTWKAQSNVSGYGISLTSYAGKTSYSYVSSNSTVLTLDVGTTWTVHVFAYNGSVTGADSDDLTFCVGPAKITNLSASVAKGGDVTLTWTKSTGAAGYKIKNNTTNSVATIIISDSKVSWSESGLTAGKKYTYSVWPMCYDEEGNMKYGPKATVTITAQ